MLYPLHDQHLNSDSHFHQNATSQDNLQETKTPYETMDTQTSSPHDEPRQGTTPTCFSIKNKSHDGELQTTETQSYLRLVTECYRLLATHPYAQQGNTHHHSQQGDQDTGRHPSQHRDKEKMQPPPQKDEQYSDPSSEPDSPHGQSSESQHHHGLQMRGSGPICISSK